MRAAIGHQLAKLRVAGTVLADRDQRRLQISYLGSSTAELATWVAILVYGYRIGGPTTVGVVAVAQLVPSSVLAPPLAAAADRVSRRAGLTIGYGLQACFAGATGLAISFGLPASAVVALAAAYAVALSGTRSVHGASIPELGDSPRTALAANAITAMAEGIGTFVGPAIAGVLLLVGPAAVFLAMAAVLCAGAVSVASLRAGGARPVTTAGGGAGHGALRILVRDREVRALLLLGGIGRTVLGALDVLVVVLAVEMLGLGESGAGYLNSLIGVGALAGGAVAVGLVGRPGLGRAVGAGSGAMGLPIALVGLVPAAAPLLSVTGFGQTYGDVAARTLVQRLVPSGILARAFGALEGMAMAGLAAGALVAPALMAVWGARPAFLIVGAMAPVGFLAASSVVARADRRARVPSEAIALLAGVEPFTVLEPPALEALAMDAEIRRVAGDEVVVREGDTGDRAFVIVDGRFLVSASGTPVARLGPGELFGEIALLADVPRTATVTATAEGRILALHRSAFLEVVSQSAATHGALRAVARRRLAELARVDERP